MTSRGGDKKKSRLERREFIKLGASGVAVTLATYTGATSAQESASSAEAPEFDGTGLPTAEAATDTPSADGIGDPEFTLFEDWQEPWIWRPEQWGEDPLILTTADTTQLTSTVELSLLQKLIDYPDIVEIAARDLSPHLIAFYLRELAAEFHSYYNSSRFLVPEIPLRLARLALIASIRQVLVNGLTLLGVSAPDKM